MSPPTDWLKFWIRFGCALAVFGFLPVLGVVYFSSIPALLVVSLLWLGIAVYIAKGKNEDVWRKALNVMLFLFEIR